MKLKILPVLQLLTLSLLTASQAHAAPITWADSAGNTTWTSNSALNGTATSASWVGGNAPVNNIATDNAIFTSVSNAQPTLTVQTRITGVDFQIAAGGLAMSGGGGSGSLFQLGAGGIDSTLQTSGTNTITNARIALNAGSTWSLFSSADTANTSTFTFNSTVDLGTQTLTVIGQRNSAANNVGVINFSRAITGTTGTLTINSSNINNTVNLTGNNTYTGLTTVNTGIVNVQNDQSAATGGWSIVSLLNSTATQAASVNFSTGSTLSVASDKKIQLGTTANSGTYAASTLNVAGTVANSGALQLERAGILNLNSGAVWTQSGNLTVQGRGGASSTLNVNAGSEMTYSGSNTVKLNSAATSGGTGSLIIDGTGRFTTGAGFENLTTDVTGSGVSRVRLTNGGTLRLSADVANLTTQTRFDLSTGGGVIDTNGFSTTLSGVTTVGSSSTAAGITGAGSLTKNGSGALTLSGVNTHSGNTIVSAGTLKVTGSIADSSVTVNNTGTVLASSTTGTIGKGVNVTSGAILAPGGLGSVGVATVGATGLNLGTGSVFDWDITTSSTISGFDTMSVAGNIDISPTDTIFRVVLGGTALIDIQNSENTFWNTPNSTKTWSMSAIFGNALSSGMFANVQTSTDVSDFGTFTIHSSALTWTAVPEPSGALVGLLFGAGLLRRRRN